MRHINAATKIFFHIFGKWQIWSLASHSALLIYGCFGVTPLSKRHTKQPNHAEEFRNLLIRNGNWRNNGRMKFAFCDENREE